MYYSNTPRDKWTALDVMEEEMDPTPSQIYPLRQKIEQWKVDLQQWDILEKKLMLHHKIVELKKDFIKWNTR